MGTCQGGVFCCIPRRTHAVASARLAIRVTGGVTLAPSLSTALAPPAPAPAPAAAARNLSPRREGIQRLGEENVATPGQCSHRRVGNTRVDTLPFLKATLIIFNTTSKVHFAVYSVLRRFQAMRLRGLSLFGLTARQEWFSLVVSSPHH